MYKPILCRVFISIFIFSFFLYLYIDQHNHLMKQRFRVPAITKEIHLIREENKRLQYEIDQFENPQHLMELARRSEFSHLKQPFVKEVLSCQIGKALELLFPEKKDAIHVQPQPALASAQ